MTVDLSPWTSAAAALGVVLVLLTAAALWRQPSPRHRLSTTGVGPGAGRAANPPATASGVAALADRLATAVEAGLPLPSAWLHATGSSAPLRMTSTDPVDRGAAAGLNAALCLADERGLPPADVLRVVAEAARDLRAADSARAAAAAGPIAAARIVAALPLAGPVVAALLGVDPLDVLLGTAWGRACLVGGLALLATGAWWSHRLVRRARAEARRGT